MFEVFCLRVCLGTVCIARLLSEEAREGCEPPCECWGLNPSLPEAQPVLLEDLISNAYHSSTLFLLVSNVTLVNLPLISALLCCAAPLPVAYFLRHGFISPRLLWTSLYNWGMTLNSASLASSSVLELQDTPSCMPLPAYVVLGSNWELQACSASIVSAVLCLQLPLLYPIVLSQSLICLLYLSVCFIVVSILFSLLDRVKALAGCCFWICFHEYLFPKHLLLPDL